MFYQFHFFATKKVLQSKEKIVRSIYTTHAQDYEQSFRLCIVIVSLSISMSNNQISLSDLLPDLQDLFLRDLIPLVLDADEVLRPGEDLLDTILVWVGVLAGGAAATTADAGCCRRTEK